MKTLKKMKRIKAVMVHTFSNIDFGERMWTGKNWQLPADAESYKCMVEQGVTAMLKVAYRNAGIQCAGSQTHHATHPSRVSKEDRAYYASYVRAILRGYGIIQPKKGRK